MGFIVKKKGMSVVVVLTLLAFTGKYFVALLVPNMGFKDKTFLGLSMIPRGEVGLIFAKLRRVTGALDNEIYFTLVLVVVITTLLPPILLKYYFKADT